MTRRILLAVLALAAAAVPAPAAPTGAEAPAAVLDGEAIPASEVRDLMAGFSVRTGPADAARALDMIIDNRLLFAEGKRRGFQRDPALAASLGEYRDRVVLEEHLLATYPERLRPSEADLDKVLADKTHGRGEMAREKWAEVITAGRVKEMLEGMVKERGATTSKTYYPDAYQKENKSGKPTGQLVVARIAERDVTWDEVIANVKPANRRPGPPLEGMYAMHFARAIDEMAGRTSLLAEAERNMDAIRPAVDRRVGMYQNLLVVQKLRAEETGKIPDAGKKAEAMARLTSALRSKATIEIHDEVLKDLGK